MHCGLCPVHPRGGSGFLHSHSKDLTCVWGEFSNNERLFLCFYRKNRSLSRVFVHILDFSVSKGLRLDSRKL